MNAKKQLDFMATIGSNKNDVTEAMMLQKIFEMEIKFNEDNPNMRLHFNYCISGVKANNE
jgi:hypothetical protein